MHSEYSVVDHWWLCEIDEKHYNMGPLRNNTDIIEMWKATAIFQMQMAFKPQLLEALGTAKVISRVAMLEKALSDKLHCLAPTKNVTTWI